MDNNKTLWTSRQAASELGLTSRTIRRFCNAGLITGTKRAGNGYRVFDAQQIEQLKAVNTLSQCGLTLSELKSIVRASGKTKKAVLETKRRQIWQKIEDLQAGIDLIEREIEIIEQR